MSPPRIRINHYSKYPKSCSEQILANYNGRLSSIFELVTDHSGVFDLYTCDTLLDPTLYQQTIAKRYAKHNNPRALWIQEVRDLRKGLFTAIEADVNCFMKRYNFDYIFSIDKELSDLNPSILYLHGNGASIMRPGIYKKSKLVSMIASDKKLTPAQTTRVNYVRKLRGQLDLYGRGYNEIACKSAGLNDYMFSVAIENIFSKGTFTEKLLDCFLTGTIPIYLGATELNGLFDVRGIIQLDDDFSIDRISPELYADLFGYVIKNYCIAMDMLFPLDRALCIAVDLPSYYPKRYDLFELHHNIYQSTLLEISS